MKDIIIEKNGLLYKLKLDKNNLDSENYNLLWLMSCDTIETKEDYSESFKKLYTDKYDLEYLNFDKKYIYSSW